MDLTKMQRKLDAHQYSSLKQFDSDVQLIFRNCRKFNGRGSPFTKVQGLELVLQISFFFLNTFRITIILHRQRNFCSESGRGALAISRTEILAAPCHCQHQSSTKRLRESKIFAATMTKLKNQRRQKTKLNIKIFLPR